MKKRVLFHQRNCFIGNFVRCYYLRPDRFISNSPQTLSLSRVKFPHSLAGHQVDICGLLQKSNASCCKYITTKQTRMQNHPFLDDPVLRHFFGDQLEERKKQNSSLGSGVIISKEGFILTNHHVIESADEIEVALSDGRKAAAKVVGTDPETDLAVLKTNLENLPTIVMGNPSNVAVGDVVLAIGNPFGVGQTVTMGIISALERTQLGLSTFENFIQTGDYRQLRGRWLT